jgi:site-specific DNA recombinase
VGRPGLGWEYPRGENDNGRRVVQAVPEEAETVQRIVGIREGGLTLRAIAETLRREGYRTKRGGRWAPETVRKVLARLAV